MSKSDSFLSMQRAITNYVKKNLPVDKNQVQVGIIRGDSVIIGNKTYRQNAIADMFYDDGDRVYCLVPDSGTEAAVVGKA